MAENLVTYKYKVTKAQRNELNGHSSFMILFTGLSGSGKSTLANTIEKRLFEMKIKTYVLDGDNVRSGINQNLGFSAEDRSENNRRIGEISKLFIDAGCVVLAAFIAPFKKDRENIKQTVGSNNYFEVFVNTNIEECERRDTKGLYKKAKVGMITNMTGVTSPYEVPESPDIVITPSTSPEESAELIIAQIKHKLLL